MGQRAIVQAIELSKGLPRRLRQNLSVLQRERRSVYRDRDPEGEIREDWPLLLDHHCRGDLLALFVFRSAPYLREKSSGRTYVKARKYDIAYTVNRHCRMVGVVISDWGLYVKLDKG